MSYGQYLGEPGGAFPPQVQKEFFQQMLQFRGQTVRLWHTATVVDCPCFNSEYQVADPDCTQCSGTGKVGGYTAEPDMAFIAAVFINPEVRQDQHQRFMTRMGPLETMDGRMYCEGRWYDDIHLKDIIMLKNPGKTEGTELVIISKSPRYGGSGEIIFIRCDLEKQPTRLRTDATDIKGLV